MTRQPEPEALENNVPYKAVWEPKAKGETCTPCKLIQIPSHVLKPVGEVNENSTIKARDCEALCRPVCTPLSTLINDYPHCAVMRGWKRNIRLFYLKL